MSKRGLTILALAGALAAPSWSQPAQAPALVALANIERGQWVLRSREDPSENRSVCIADPRSLLQIRHSGANCSRYVIESAAKTATVHYTCPGQGHGRTTIRVETGKLVQIESQGIVMGEPFAVALEGRKTGACGTATGALLSNQR